MSDALPPLTPAASEDLVSALAFALRFAGRKRVHDAGAFMADIVARRLVDHLERAGFVVMKRPPAIGGAALARGFEGHAAQLPAADANRPLDDRDAQDRKGA